MFFLGDMTGLLATSGILPPFIAAFCPPIFILAATLAFFSMREDGEVNFNDEERGLWLPMCIIIFGENAKVGTFSVLNYR